MDLGVPAGFFANVRHILEEVVLELQDQIFSSLAEGVGAPLEAVRKLVAACAEGSVVSGPICDCSLTALRPLFCPPYFFATTTPVGVACLSRNGLRRVVSSCCCSPSLEHPSTDGNSVSHLLPAPFSQWQ